MPDDTRTETVDDLERRLEMYRLIFESIHNGAMVTDADGIITHFNRFYGQFLGVDPRAQIGRHCTEAVENSRMHIVAKTGQAEINHSQLIQGQKMVVQRVPIVKDGKVIAVFGQVMFKDIRDVSKLARELSLLESKVKLYEEELLSLRSTRYTFESIVGRSDALRKLKSEALKAAANNFPVLITGESGTGKELFAQAIHHASARGKPGKFELAHSGTIFLDEIGDLPAEMQPKLLRAIEDKEFERVGGTKIVRSDFRVIAATNQHLESMLAAGRFRKDLFYRLNVISLHIPPLRERPSDIAAIAENFLQQTAREANLEGISIDADAERALRAYAWPGNVRELTNVMERTVSALEGHIIRVADLPFYVPHGKRRGASRQQTSLREMQSQSEREAIWAALKETGFQKARAARILGIHRTLLYKKMKKYDLPLQPPP